MEGRGVTLRPVAMLSNNSQRVTEGANCIGGAVGSSLTETIILLVPCHCEWSGGRRQRIGELTRALLGLWISHRLLGGGGGV